jgi:hypothetical protein
LKRFIHIPKNAGTSVVAFCNKNNIDILYGVPKRGTSLITKKHSTLQDWSNECSDKFAIVRNPYTRLISWFCYLKNLTAYKCDFKKFVMEKLEPTAIRFKTPSPWTQQFFWISEFGNLGNISLFPFEQINKLLPAYLQITAEFPHNNATNIHGQNFLNWYDSETSKIVEQHFATDFNIWTKLN